MEDEKILKKDKLERKLGKNVCHCIMYRKSEKVILHFLKDCARRVEHFLTIESYDLAKKEIRSWSNMEKEKGGLYFLLTLCDLIFDLEKTNK